jgi:hypothetical protein
MRLIRVRQESAAPRRSPACKAARQDEKKKVFHAALLISGATPKRALRSLRSTENESRLWRKSRRGYFCACSPGDDSHSFMWLATSIWRAPSQECIALGPRWHPPCLILQILRCSGYSLPKGGATCQLIFRKPLPSLGHEIPPSFSPPFSGSGVQQFANFEVPRTGTQAMGNA